MKGEGKLFFSLFKDMYVYIVIQCMPVKSQKKKGLPFLFIPNKCKQNKCWKYKIEKNSGLPNNMDTKLNMLTCIRRAQILRNNFCVPR